MTLDQAAVAAARRARLPAAPDDLPGESFSFLQDLEFDPQMSGPSRRREFPRYRRGQATRRREGRGMEMNGSRQIAASREVVWAALNDAGC